MGMENKNDTMDTEKVNSCIPNTNYARFMALEEFQCGDRMGNGFSGFYIDESVIIEDGAEIHPMVVLRGRTVIRKGAKIFSFCELIDTEVGEDCEMRASYAAGAIIGARTTVGPFACIRKGTVIGEDCRIGDFVEIKNSFIGNGVKAAHLAYVGDSTVGPGVNVGCGVVFANFDGKQKRGVNVGAGAFIGCNANLIAPLQIGEGAYIAAGSTVTEDVPPGTLCIARARQIIKPHLPLSD
jgi:bifunctional UDP-N-acetylglucosamine pyrophosphorylase/glucosamine-1-phosphate N-acetyltransferase